MVSDLSNKFILLLVCFSRSHRKKIKTTTPKTNTADETLMITSNGLDTAGLLVPSN